MLHDGYRFCFTLGLTFQHCIADLCKIWLEAMQHKSDKSDLRCCISSIRTVCNEWKQRVVRFGLGCFSFQVSDGIILAEICWNFQSLSFEGCNYCVVIETSPLLVAGKAPRVSVLKMYQRIHKQGIGGFHRALITFFIYRNFSVWVREW